MAYLRVVSGIVVSCHICHICHIIYKNPHAYVCTLYIHAHTQTYARRVQNIVANVANSDFAS